MSEQPRVDPVQQISLWLRQYCEAVKAKDVAAVFRIAHTMHEQGFALASGEALKATAHMPSHFTNASLALRRGSNR